MRALALAILALAVAGCAAPPDVPDEPGVWRLGEAALAEGGDPDVVRMGDAYRAFFTYRAPAALEVRTAVSDDGTTWRVEEGWLERAVAHPAIVALPEGGWRLFVQNAGAIHSLASADGAEWTRDAGMRLVRDHTVPHERAGFGDMSVAWHAGRFVLAYASTAPEAPAILFATSEDGLDFTKRGVLVADARAPDLAVEDGTLRLYFARGGSVLVANVTSEGAKDARRALDADATGLAVFETPEGWRMLLARADGGIWAASRT